MSLLGRALERRSAPTQEWGDSSIPPPGSSLLGGTSMAGVHIDEKTALSIMTVYTCVAIIADAVSTMPLDVFQKRSGAARVEVEPRPPVADTPWAEITLQDWLSQVMVSLLLRGNFYGYVAERDRLGYPTQIMPLHPDQVRVRRNSDTGEREYRVNGTLVPIDDVWHVPALTVPGQLVGLNPIEYARGGFALAKATEIYGGKFFENSAHASVAISVAGNLEEEQTKAMARSWAAAHQGVGKAHLPAILTGGATLETLSITPDDAQFLQTRDYQKMDILGWYRVPPHMAGAVDKTTSWGTGIEQQETGFVRNTLGGWIGRIEAGYRRILPAPQYAKFNLNGRLRGDTLQRYQAYTLARNGGWMNVDEVRDKEDMEPLPDGLGQDYLQPLNFVAIGQAPPAPTPEGSTQP